MLARGRPEAGTATQHPDYHSPMIKWLVVATGVLSLAAVGAPALQQLDTEALNRTEELSESLANDLLTLSVAARNKDRSTMERFFADVEPSAARLRAPNAQCCGCQMWSVRHRIQPGRCPTARSLGLGGFRGLRTNYRQSGHRGLTRQTRPSTAGWASGRVRN